MASEGSTRRDPAAEAAQRRPRTAAEQRAERTTSDDPAVLAAEIERTREELAETLDAIADKVSPKRVASRTKKKVGDAVKDGAGSASATVKAGTSQLKDAVKEKKDAVTGSDTAGQPSAAPEPGRPGAVDPVTTPTAALPTPAGASAVPSGLHAVPPPAPASPLPLGPPAAAGAVVAAVVAFLLLRRRRTKRRSWR